MTKLHATKDFWIGALRAEGPAFSAALAEQAPDAPVPTCPEWTVTDLIGHLGGFYDWIGTHLTRGVTTAPENIRPASTIPAGVDPKAWWDERFAAVLATLEGVEEDLPAWNPMPAPKKAAFWLRRAAQHTAVHRWDAQMTIGLTEPIEAKLAVDGIAELLDTLLPGGRGAGARDRYGVVQLVASDLEHEWFVRLRGEGLALLDTDTILDSDDHHARVLATGPASDLLLAFWGRLGFDSLEIAGERSLLDGLRIG
jgi:uncharacterized protein (TIGR03083 family)